MRVYSLPCLPMSSPGAPTQAFRDVEPIVGGRRGLACGIREPLSKLFDLVSEREVFPLEPELFVLQLIDARPQPREFARATRADVVARLRLARSFRFLCLSGLRLRGARGLRCRCLFHRLLTRLAVLANALLNWGDFPSCFLLRTDRPDRLMVGLDRLADLPVGLARIGLDQLGDQLAPLFGIQMPPVDVA